MAALEWGVKYICEIRFGAMMTVKLYLLKLLAFAVGACLLHSFFPLNKAIHMEKMSAIGHSINSVIETNGANLFLIELLFINHPLQIFLLNFDFRRDNLMNIIQLRSVRRPNTTDIHSDSNLM